MLLIDEESQTRYSWPSFVRSLVVKFDWKERAVHRIGITQLAQQAMLDMTTRELLDCLRQLSGQPNPRLSAALTALEYAWRIRSRDRFGFPIPTVTIRELRAEFPSMRAIRAVSGIGPKLAPEIFELFARLEVPLQLL